MARGRPPSSIIRDRIGIILSKIKKGYGYEIYKEYIKAYPKVTMRVVYYHLTKGVELGIFKISEVRMEKGDYSWGGEAKKIYYSLNKPM